MGESQDLFKALSNASENVYVFQCDVPTDYSDWSENAVDYFNLPPDYHNNVLPRWVERIYPDDRDAYIEDVNAVFGGKKDRHKIQYRVKNKYGDYVWVECTGNITRDDLGELKLFAGIITRLDNQSKYDPLTKKLVIHQFYLNNALESDSIFLMFEIDGFRRILHNYSYEIGNDLIIELGRELEIPSLKQVIYHVNDDSFLVEIPNVSGEIAQDYYKSVLCGFQEYCQKQYVMSSVRLFCGGESFSPGECDKETLVNRLEYSLEKARNREADGIVFFSKIIEDEYKRIQDISIALDHAIANDFEGFEMFYQPILTVDTDSIQTVEALLRFYTKQLGWVSPIEFIPILEANRSIKDVGIWVMKEVIHQNQIWNQKKLNVITSFNVSYLQLYNDSFISQLIEEVERCGVKPNSIIVELTESSRIIYPEMLSNMFNRLIEYGFYVALDDFGVDHSTLTVLRDIPATTVKIDHSFVRTLTQEDNRVNEANIAIISGIITMCKHLSYDVVIEGVETDQIAELMKQLGAKYLQGFYFSKPVPSDEVEKYFSLQAEGHSSASKSY